VYIVSKVLTNYSRNEITAKTDSYTKFNVKSLYTLETLCSRHYSP